MHEVTEPELVLGQVNVPRRWRWPETLGGDDAIVPMAITSGVAVGEGREHAVEAADNEENAAEVLVDGVAVSGVGHDGAEELEKEDRAGWEELDEAPNSGERLFCYGTTHYVFTFSPGNAG